MKRTAIVTLLLSAFSFMAFTSLSVLNWKISEEYAIKFSGKGAEGSFSKLEGTIEFDPAALANSSMEVSVEVATISTGNKTKDKHARGKNWFNAEQYPKIRFQSKSFTQKGSGYEVKGELTLHGVTKEVLIPFTFQRTAKGGLFEGAFSVKRKDYGIKGPFMAITVGDTFDIELKVAVK